MHKITKAGASGPMPRTHRHHHTTTTLPRTRTHARTHTHTHTAKVGASVAIKIEATNDEQTHLLYGRHFDHKKPLYSQISRQGVAALKVGHFTVLVHA